MAYRIAWREERRLAAKSASLGPDFQVGDLVEAKDPSKHRFIVAAVEKRPGRYDAIQMRKEDRTTDLGNGWQDGFWYKIVKRAKK